MRARIAGIVVCAVLPWGCCGGRHQADAGRNPIDLLHRRSFTAATPSGVKFKMTFTADGKVRRVPAGKGGAKSEGDWKLDESGYCTTWKGGKPNCFTSSPPTRTNGR